MKISTKDKNRFWAKVLIKGVNDCWEWQAGRSSSGYGVFSIKTKWIGAHVVSFIIHNGYKPDSTKNRLVMHDCENPSCVNPHHLLEGTPKENGNYPGCITKCRTNIKDKPWFGTTGQNHPRWGMKHSKATKRILSAKASLRGGWHKGLKRSKETRERISLAARGENSGRAKLNDVLVRQIFYSPKRKSIIARELGVDASIISRIKASKAWVHITRELQ